MRDDPLVPELGVVGVIVSDIERAVRFYERLGLHFPDNPDAAGHGHAETKAERASEILHARFKARFVLPFVDD